MSLINLRMLVDLESEFFRPSDQRLDLFNEQIVVI